MESCKQANILFFLCYNFSLSSYILYQVYLHNTGHTRQAFLNVRRTSSAKKSFPVAEQLLTTYKMLN